MRRIERDTEKLFHKIGKNVQAERESLQLSRPDLLNRVRDLGCDMSKTTLWRIENGLSMSVPTLYVIARALGLKMEHLITGRS